MALTERQKAYTVIEPPAALPFVPTALPYLGRLAMFYALSCLPLRVNSFARMHAEMCPVVCSCMLFYLSILFFWHTYRFLYNEFSLIGYIGIYTVQGVIMYTKGGSLTRWTIKG